MDDSDIDRAAMNLVADVREMFTAEMARNPDCAGQFERALALMSELRPDPERPDPVTFPACRHLGRALDLGEAGPAAPIANEIRRLEQTLAWAQNPRYNAGNRGAEFMDNYAWSGLGLAGNDKMSFGVLLLGPGVTYPPTSYDSEGIFLVIGGTPEWKSGDGPWVRVGPGSIICRPYGGAEGKRPGDEPMLALYAWMYR